ncbi:MAG: electron transporter SenC [Acidobacteria bacterium RBG_16_68_9]|nr:MAG: electron transporter SenC [Acidobacteria bacterium RBG_16_68_9]
MSVITLGLSGPALAQGWIGRGAKPEADRAATEQPGLLSKIRIDQKLDEQVPLDLPFVDEHGRAVTLGQYFGTRPVVLALVYYECPMLCTQVLNGLTSVLTVLKFDAGREFDVVAVSFDPGETAGLARDKKRNYLGRYGRPGTDAGWHFLTGKQTAIDRLTDAVGFRYAYDEKTDQYAHAATIIVLTPQGRVSRYFYGIEYAPRDLRLGLVEASENRIGSVVDQALLLCYHYDPSEGKYGVAIINVIRLIGLLTIAGVGVFIVAALRRERRQAHA